ncbi:MAG: glycosyltransferase family 4 protein [Desulfomonilaceae bacterium]
MLRWVIRNSPKANSSSGRFSHEEKPRLVLVTTVPLTLRSFFQGQITYLKNKGFDIHAVSSPGRDLNEFAQKEQVPIHGITMTRGISPFADVIAAARLWMLFMKIRPAVVHASTPKAGVLSMVAASFARVPVRFYTLHGIMTEIRSGPTKILLKILEWIACTLADQVLAVSRSVMDGVIGQSLCSGGKIKVLAHGSCNGIDALNRFNPAGQDKTKMRGLRSHLLLDEKVIVIGFVGRLVKDKGIVELASAWERIKAGHDNVRLLMIGPKEPQDPVPPRILEKLGCDDRVAMPGFVSNEELPAYYRIMDIVVLPTYREGFPYSILEASAMGLPVVASRVTGCVEAVVDGVTGILVPPRDVQSLVEAICTYVEDPELRVKHGQAGRDRVLAHFRQEPIWEALSEEYLFHIGRKGLSFSPAIRPKGKTSDLRPEQGRVP